MPIAQLGITKANLKQLASVLAERHRTGQEFFTSGAEKDYGEYVRAYLASEAIDLPYPGASEVTAPVIRVGIEGLMAQTHDAMFSQDPLISVRAASDTSDAVDTADDLTRYYGDYFFAKELPLSGVGEMFLQDMFLNGTALLGSRFDQSLLIRRMLDPVQKVTNKTLDFGEFQGIPLNPIESTITETFTERVVAEPANKVLLENIDITNIRVSPVSGPSLQAGECPWYYTIHWLSFDEVARKKVTNEYDIDDLDDVRRVLFDHVSETDRAAREEARASQATTEPRMQIVNFYMQLALPTSYELDGKTQNQRFMAPEGVPEEVIVTYAPDMPLDKRILRVIPLDRIRGDGMRPHVSGRYSKLKNQFYGIGIAASYMGIQQAMNDMLRNMLNFGQLQNLPWGFYEPSAMGDLGDDFFLEPGGLYPVMNANGINFPRFQGDPSFWQSAMNILQGWVERGTAVSDFTRGASPSRPNAPETARGTLALIQQSSLAFNWKVKQFTIPILESVRQVHALHQRYLRKPVSATFFNDRTGAMDTINLNPAIFRRPVEFDFVLNPNRAAEQNVNQTLFSILGPILAQATGDPNALRPIAEDLWKSHGKKNFAEVWPEPTAPELSPEAAAGAPGAPGAEAGPPQLPGAQPENVLDFSSIPIKEEDGPETKSVQLG